MNKKNEIEINGEVYIKKSAIKYDKKVIKEIKLGHDLAYNRYDQRLNLETGLLWFRDKNCEWDFIKTELSKKIDKEKEKNVRNNK
ncbi:MAG: hypothetical protein BV457_00025 [Thermoplasmata archaeon M9B1D]|nr:MAG: hypothetical protein BV457_00025 [Thermoplasmata archaeon M9B1D]PNX52249.1 MAG: hypothetical protein BV456_00270 [Thermoplasmata archaeon M8B2D]